MAVYIRMLSDLAKCSAMSRSKSLLDVLDHRCLLVERSARDDESLGRTELFNDV